MTTTIGLVRTMVLIGLYETKTIGYTCYEISRRRLGAPWPRCVSSQRSPWPKPRIRRKLNIRLNVSHRKLNPGIRLNP